MAMVLHVGWCAGGVLLWPAWGPKSMVMQTHRSSTHTAEACWGHAQCTSLQLWIPTIARLKTQLMHLLTTF